MSCRAQVPRPWISSTSRGCARGRGPGSRPRYALPPGRPFDEKPGAAPGRFWRHGRPPRPARAGYTNARVWPDRARSNWCATDRRRRLLGPQDVLVSGGDGQADGPAAAVGTDLHIHERLGAGVASEPSLHAALDHGGFARRWRREASMCCNLAKSCSPCKRSMAASFSPAGPRCGTRRTVRSARPSGWGSSLTSTPGSTPCQPTFPTRASQRRSWALGVPTI